MALADAMKKGTRPTGLRSGTARARCGLCRHFDGKGMCRKFNWPVTANQLSDGFSAATAPAKEKM